MKFGVYAIRDSLAGFLTPVPEQSDAVALRNFSHAFASRDSVMHFRPEDFDLYKIGFYDTESGLLSSCPPTMICAGSSVKEVKSDAV